MDDACCSKTGPAARDARSRRYSARPTTARRRIGARRIGLASTTSRSTRANASGEKPGPSRSTIWERWLAWLRRRVSASNASRKASAPVSGRRSAAGGILVDRRGQRLGGLEVLGGEQALVGPDARRFLDREHELGHRERVEPRLDQVRLRRELAVDREQVVAQDPMDQIRELLARPAVQAHFASNVGKWLARRRWIGRRSVVYDRNVPRHVAIRGAGPAGASLAAYLARHRARRGAAAEFEVTLFDGGMRPPIVIGESLVPAVVPFLQRLGIEEEVASYSIFKPGATFRFGLEDVLMFRFDEVRGARTTYSYNVPRDRFDASVRDAALAAGARLVPQHARLEREESGERVRLSDASLAAAGLTRQPDYIVDAGGRNRQLARLVDLPEVKGDRRDTALHA